MARKKNFTGAHPETSRQGSGRRESGRRVLHFWDSTRRSRHLHQWRPFDPDVRVALFLVQRHCSYHRGSCAETSEADQEASHEKMV